jgi:TetR/AcrR family transcriptional regulator, copper-responsive repressor
MVTAARGRPRAFDAGEALDVVLARFWRDGYDGTSMQDLADEVGVSKPSLYAAYGNKEALFLAALERYSTTFGARQAAELDREPDARRAVESVLRSMIALHTGCGRPTGCMVVASASLCAAPHIPEALQASISGLLQRSCEALESRLRRADEEGHLAPGADPEALAQYFNAILQGISVQARSGAPREALEQVIAVAMQVWPVQAASGTG